jgi:hypothetical protein
MIKWLMKFTVTGGAFIITVGALQGKVTAADIALAVVFGLFATTRYL